MYTYGWMILLPHYNHYLPCMQLTSPLSTSWLVKLFSKIEHTCIHVSKGSAGVHVYACNHKQTVSQNVQRADRNSHRPRCWLHACATMDDEGRVLCCNHFNNDILYHAYSNYIQDAIKNKITQKCNSLSSFLKTAVSCT